MNAIAEMINSEEAAARCNDLWLELQSITADLEAMRGIMEERKKLLLMYANECERLSVKIKDAENRKRHIERMIGDA